MGSSFRTRKRLFEAQGGKCHYCGEQMILAKGPADGVQPPRLCTVEHLIDRYHQPTRDLPVAACHDCNDKANKRRQLSLPRDVVLSRTAPGFKPIYLKERA